MEDNTNKHWKKGILQPNEDFTSQVMQKIEAEEEALAHLLSKHGKMTPSTDFTAELMQKLEGKVPVVPYTPVISKRMWIGIAAVGIGIIFWTLFTGSESYPDKGFEYPLQNFNDSIHSMVTEGSVFSYFAMGILILSIGLVIEQRVGRIIFRK